MLQIVIGGKAQGKLSYVLEQSEYKKEDVYDGENRKPGEKIKAGVMNHFHLYIRKALREHYDMDELVNDIISCRGDLVLLCDEVGSGVVPLDAFERHYREQVGRVMCRLTGSADKVIRVQCGIGTILKN